jgi:hypothetical protein
VVTAQPKSWPASVTPAQALGYLLAHHVPRSFLPDALHLMREAAGWSPPSGRQPAVMTVTPAMARPWVQAAARHARSLGPPPGLSDLLAVLGDGIIRTDHAARTALADAGAGELANPRVLIDFAGWCGVDPPFSVLPVGTRRQRKVSAYLRDPEDLTRARAIVATEGREYGLISAATALERLAAQGLRLDSGADSQGLRDLLGISGTEHWWWPRPGVVTPLTTAMDRLHALRTPVALVDVPPAVERIPRRRRAHISGQWPLAVDGIRAWANAHPGWHVNDQDAIEPQGPHHGAHRHDHLIAAALTGRELSWKDLHRVLIEAGLSPPTAGAAILYSPAARRTGTGYTFIGDHRPT